MVLLAIKVRKDFNEIIKSNERILRALLAQKVRQNELSEKYKGEVIKEIEIPSNRFMYWSKIVSPFLDSVDSGSLIDYELIQQYKKYIQDLVKYESNYVVNESDIVELEAGFDECTEIILKLEKKLSDQKEEFLREIHHLKTRYSEGGPTDQEEVPEEEIKEEEERKIEDDNNFLLDEEEGEEKEEEINNSEEEEQKEKPPEGQTKDDRKLKRDFKKLMEGYKEKYDQKKEEDEDQEPI